MTPLQSHGGTPLRGGLGAFAARVVDHAEIVVRLGVFGIERGGLLEMLLSLILPALASEQHRQVILRGRIVGGQLDQALELLDRLVRLLQVDIAICQAFVSAGVSRIDGKGCAKLVPRLAEVRLADV